jgi:hypothetical protein
VSGVFSAFGNGLDNTMWGPLLEKAFAKFSGSYNAIAHGVSSIEFVRATKGLPGFTFVTKSTPNFISLI